MPSPRPEVSPTRTLVGGCLLLLGLLGAVVGLSIWLWTSLTGPAGDAPPRGAPRSDSAGDARLTRSRRDELERELEQVERDLAFARGQARVTIDPATKDAWSDRAAELQRRRDAILGELGR